jgi:hypothetical protein
LVERPRQRVVLRQLYRVISLIEKLTAEELSLLFAARRGSRAAVSAVEHGKRCAKIQDVLDRLEGG